MNYLVYMVLLYVRHDTTVPHFLYYRNITKISANTLTFNRKKDKIYVLKIGNEIIYKVVFRRSIYGRSYSYNIR